MLKSRSLEMAEKKELHCNAIVCFPDLTEHCRLRFELVELDAVAGDVLLVLALVVSNGVVFVDILIFD